MFRLLKHLVCYSGLLIPLSVYAGYGNLDIGAGEINKGTAGVGAALPQDALAAAINPAAIAFVPSSRIDIGITGISPNRGYKAPTASSIPGTISILPGDYDSHMTFIPTPSFGYLQHIKNSPISFSLSVSGAGFSTDYDKQLFAAGNASSFYRQILTNLAASWKINDKIALGSSFIFATQSLNVEGISSYAPLSVDPNNLSNKGTDFSFGAGVKIGFMAKPFSRLSIGASYQPEIAMTKVNRYSGLLPNDGSLNIPPTATAGLAVQILPTWQVGFDTQYVWYSAVPAYSNRFQCRLSNFASGDKCLGNANGTGFGWRNLTAYKFGTVWNALPTWTFRAGYLYATQVVRSSEVLLATLAPTVAQSHFTVGVSHTIKKRFQLSAMALYAPERTVSGYNTFAPDQRITVHMRDYEIGVSLGYLFGEIG